VKKLKKILTGGTILRYRWGSSRSEQAGSPRLQSWVIDERDAPSPSIRSDPDPPIQTTVSVPECDTDLKEEEHHSRWDSLEI